MNFQYLLRIIVAILLHWKRKPIQLILIVVGLTTATALWKTVDLINTTAKKSYDNASTISTLWSDQSLVSNSQETFDENYFGLFRQKGWSVTPTVKGYLPNFNEVTVIGVDIISLDQKKVTSFIPTNVRAPQFLTGSKIILAGPQTSETLKKFANLENIITSNSFPEGYAITDIETAQDILDLKGKITSLEITDNDLLDRQILLELDLYLKKYSAVAEIGSLTKSFHLNLTAFGFLSYVVGLFIVYATVKLSYEQRKGLLKSLRCIGISTKTITSLMILEILIIAFLSGALGSMCSIGLAVFLMPNVAISIGDLFGANIQRELPVNFIFFLESVFISILGAIAASLTSLSKLSSINPVETSKKIVWFEKAKKVLRYQALLSLFLLLLVILLLKFSSNLISSLVLLGTILLLAALTLPILLWLTMSFIPRLTKQKPKLNWFFADTRQQIDSLSVSLMALLIALSVNIGVGGMVGSFERTFVGWLDQRLVSELYVVSPNVKKSADLLSKFSGKVDAILPIVKTTEKIKEEIIDIYGFKIHETYIKYWPLLEASENTWDRIKNESGILINEQLARKLKISPGTKLEIITNFGSKNSFTVLGIYSDYGNPKGQVMMPLSAFEHYFPDIPKLQFAIRCDNSEIEKVKTDLIDFFGGQVNRVTDQEEIKTISKRIFQKTFAITSALSLLTLGVSGIALFTSITTLSENRNSQLAPIWAIGVTRNYLALMEAIRVLTLSITTFVFSIPLGLIVVFILTKYINLNAFYWELPIFIFPIQWTKLLIVTLSMTILSVFFHSIKLAKASPSDLLRYSSYEI